jgi:hypothetical protein
VGAVGVAVAVAVAAVDSVVAAAGSTAEGVGSIGAVAWVPTVAAPIFRVGALQPAVRSVAKVPGALSRTEVASDPIVGSVRGSVIVRSPANNPVSATDLTQADDQRPMIAPTQTIGRLTGNARSG